MLDQLSYGMLVPVALILAVAPISPQPHLVEKLIMLKAGTLVKPIDIFDLIMHATPIILLGAKLIKDFAVKG